MNKALIETFRRVDLEAIERPTNQYSAVMGNTIRIKAVVGFNFPFALGRSTFEHFQYNVLTLSNILSTLAIISHASVERTYVRSLQSHTVEYPPKA